MDLTGRTINGVEVIRLENPEKSSSRYICKCVCGELMVKESVLQHVAKCLRTLGLNILTVK